MTDPTLQRPHRPDTPQALLGDLQDVWTSLEGLLVSLDDEDFAAPTACPGWTVADVVAHVVGTELMMAGEPVPDVEVPDLPHLRNPIGRANESWIQERRPWPPSRLVEEFRSMIARRTAELSDLSQADVDAPSWTPAGDDTLGRFLQIRTFDTWIHELDIRDALGSSGHESGPAALRTLVEVGNALGFLVGKRAGAPEGAWVRIELPGPEAAAFDVVVDGRAQLVDDRPGGEPSVLLSAGSTEFVRCVAGRVDPMDSLAEGRTTVLGDEDLGRRLVAALPYTI